MRQQQWLLLLKYPYASAVLACVWIGSAAMIFIDRSMPVLTVIAIDMVTSWVISWMSFKSGSLK